MNSIVADTAKFATIRAVACGLTFAYQGGNNQAKAMVWQPATERDGQSLRQALKRILSALAEIEADLAAKVDYSAPR
jgi:hypothetical protein